MQPHEFFGCVVSRILRTDPGKGSGCNIGMRECPDYNVRYIAEGCSVSSRRIRADDDESTWD